ncbi:hypothetical protein JCM31826_13290 [Thermaurantimonas aggregans]|uniref:Uncharacterized protein n=1 Tax=Thermaurantimonas aggregans TaxID=2173829 RepID=A0A401XLF1_9FLAO|nr:PD-(D/E)XK nuclease domain-containing protein [Thermaurantimonas aggregans]GCD77847.1 hypothetical protein JCM31826_13290 [Thermaurantimonas aggregans]
MLADAFTYGRKPGSATSVLSKLLEALKHKREEVLKDAINQVFADIPYDLWIKNNEKFFHALVYLIFTLAGMHIFSEVHTSRGRADSIVVLGDSVYCQEFRLDGSAEEVLRQIEQNGYLDRWKNSGKHFHKIGINFNSQTCQVEELLWV